MAFTPSDNGGAQLFGTGDIDCDAVAVSEGDLITVSIGMYSTGYCDGVTDTAGNDYDVRTAITDGGESLVMASCIGALAHASNVVTASFANDTSTAKAIQVGVTTPDGGDTVSLDVTMSKTSSYEASPWETDTDNTTGTDEVCVVGLQAEDISITYSNHEIPGGTGATVFSDDPGYGHTGWYRILTEPANGLFAEVDPSGATHYSVEMLCFKSEAAAEGTNAQINIGDAWKAIAAVQIKIGEDWKAVEGMQVNIGDAWKTIF